MAPSLKNPKLRVERAKEHLDVLYIKTREFLDAKPFKISKYEDIQHSLYVMKIHMTVIDLKLAIIAGDAIDNLRAALDHIAWQLALMNVKKPHARTSFPIIDKNTSENMRRFGYATRDIPADAINEIDALQPYHGGDAFKDDPLWKLDKLCNINKHRVIPAQGTALDFKIPKGIIPNIVGSLDNGYIVTMPLAVKGKMEFAPTPIGDILLGSEVDGLSISIWELYKIYDFIRDSVFPRFTRFFPE